MATAHEMTSVLKASSWTSTRADFFWYADMPLRRQHHDGLVSVYPVKPFEQASSLIGSLLPP
jgi:hypothetical protein